MAPILHYSGFLLLMFKFMFEFDSILFKGDQITLSNFLFNKLENKDLVEVRNNSELTVQAGLRTQIKTC